MFSPVIKHEAGPTFAAGDLLQAIKGRRDLTFCELPNLVDGTSTDSKNMAKRVPERIGLLSR
jgi:hypothetical protein